MGSRAADNFRTAPTLADVLVAGIDLAASPANTAVALLDGMALATVTAAASDDDLVAATGPAEKIGVDCPLGWPAAFVEFMRGIPDGAAPPPAGDVADRGRLAYRETDRQVAADRPPLRPLSVSADRIAHVAFRCAALLPRLESPVDRTGHGRVVEVYPAGSLHAWELPFRGYKGSAGTAARAEIVAVLGDVLDLGPYAAACLASDHVLDAVISAVAARAAALGRATLPTGHDLPVAALEGWIALPHRGRGELHSIVT